MRRRNRVIGSKGVVAYHVILLATTAGVADAKNGVSRLNNVAMGGIGRLASMHGIEISRGGGIGDDQIGFFGNFQDELRMMREEIELESQESLESLHVLSKNQQDEEIIPHSEQPNQDDVGMVKNDTKIASDHEGTRARRAEPQVHDIPERVPGSHTSHPIQPNRKSKARRLSRAERKKMDDYEASKRHEEDAYEEDVKVILKPAKARTPKRKSVTVTKWTEEVPATAFSGGANSSKTRKPRKPLSGHDKQLQEMKKMLKVELETVEKNLTKNEWRRASVTGLLLMMLCILTTLALRIVEKSLGVP